MSLEESVMRLARSWLNPEHMAKVEGAEEAVGFLDRYIASRLDEIKSLNSQVALIHREQIPIRFCGGYNGKLGAITAYSPLAFTTYIPLPGVMFESKEGNDVRFVVKVQYDKNWDFQPYTSGLEIHAYAEDYDDDFFERTLHPEKPTLVKMLMWFKRNGWDVEDVDENEVDT